MKDDTLAKAVREAEAYYMPKAKTCPAAARNCFRRLTKAAVIFLRCAFMRVSALVTVLAEVRWGLVIFASVLFVTIFLAARVLGFAD